jgi:hypothetical protein
MGEVKASSPISHRRTIGLRAMPCALVGVTAHRVRRARTACSV